MRAIQKHVESPLSVKILQGEFKEGGQVLVDYVEDEGVVFRPIESSTPVEIDEEVIA
jgi:ATP-dependent Clp protease ATP-binding subunit ClpA